MKITEKLLDEINNNEYGFSLFFNYENDLTLDLSDAFVMKAHNPYDIELLEDKAKYLENIKNNPKEYYSKYEIFNIEEIFTECGIEDWIEEICDSIKSDFDSNLKHSIRENITNDALEINKIYEKINNSITDVIYEPELEELYNMIMELCPKIDTYMSEIQKAGDFYNKNKEIEV